MYKWSSRVLYCDFNLLSDQYLSEKKIEVCKSRKHMQLCYPKFENNSWSRDLGSLLLASNEDNGILKNCWCLECCFSVGSTFLQLAMVKIQMIFSELLTTCTLSIHIKIIAKFLKLGCRTTLRRRWPPLKMTRQICRVPDFGYHCRNEYTCSFYPVMFHINENYL